jgi:YbbR domain-containing protein
VIAALRGTPAVGFAMSGVRVEPLTVVIAGPREALQAVSEVSTEEVSVAGARATVTTDAKLDVPSGVTVQGSDTVKVTATITALTGSTTFTVGIVLAGTSSSFDYALASGSALVVLSGPITTLNAVSGSSLQAVADVSGLGAGTHSVALRVAAPSGLRLGSITPSQVQVTITPVSTPTPTPTATP